MTRTVRIGTRGSALAMVQAEWVAARLRARWPGRAIELRIVQTDGDRSQAQGTPLSVVGGQGVFVTAIEQALARGEVDLAVHSLKDMSTRLEPGTVLAAVPPREDARDVLVSRHRVGLADLPSAPRIGTSSVRRAAQVRQARPDAVVVNLRGNIDTRLRKAQTDDYDAIIVAAAGILRLGREVDITAYLPPDEFVPMIGQGALGLQIRADDDDLLALVQPLDDLPTHRAVRAERAFLAALGSGCSAPVAAHATLVGQQLRLRAMLADPTSDRVLRDTLSGPATDPEWLGQHLAALLLDRLEGSSQ